ncbi:hypothetical protein [Rhodanobacter sp. DHB23]|uniref:hypothetical protein n=1 Tax=Rhodanobacter sp. DHB23 TaxID=2775923 RepID=UPI00177FF6AD|nr:hypothetical protein [Rhodanobacter sp. DHB23]MBD8873900.1 hypothetical protein [Rhodanobacter sp. DHB23]
MTTRLHTSVALALIGLSAVAVTHQAKACGLNLVRSANGQWMIAPPAKLSPAAAWQMSMAEATRNVAAAAQPKTKAMPNPLQFLEPITGLWYYTQTAEGNGPGTPDGTLIDFGFQAWHADGGEFMNSGTLPPPSGNFCEGTWAQTGAHTYQLNHFALSWDNTGTVYIGPANIREDITLSNDNNSMSGDFSITQYAPDGSTVIAYVKGTLKGTRETLDSPAPVTP